MLGLSFILAASIVPTSVLGIWPIPRSLQTGTQLLKLSQRFDISVKIPDPPQDVLAAVSRSKGFIHTDNLGRLVVGRGSSDSEGLKSAASLSSLVVMLENGAPLARPIATEAAEDLSTRDEGYSLSVPSDGSPAVITANSTLGLFRGLTTFEQLWYTYEGTIYTTVAPLTITNDSPAYPYRGFMLDTARNFFGVVDIKRALDAMSLVKINTFHWHITDSQSWPLGITEFPELAQQGAYSASETFSPADVQDIVTYAGERGIDVLMEIDTPGHSSIVGTSHPEHIACFLYTPWPTYAGEPPAGQLRLASAETTNFTAEVLSAVAKTLPSRLFSTGGDELNTACYAADEETQASLNATGRTLEEALSDFTVVTHNALHALGKSPVVWEEMVLEHNVTLSNDTVVMVWISSQNAASVAAKNFRLVHSPSDYFYLDCGAGEWIGNDPSGNSWCDPFKTWQKSYTFDPLANISSEHASLVLGGQQLLWTEQSGPENLDSIAWPRAAISAEVFWTGATLPDGFDRVGNISEALPRLHEVRYRMVQRGIGAIRLQPHWCALRPHEECDG